MDVTSSNLTTLTFNEVVSGQYGALNNYLSVDQCQDFVSAVILQRNILIAGMTFFLILMMYLEFKGKIKAFFNNAKERKEMITTMKKMIDEVGEDGRGQVSNNDANRDCNNSFDTSNGVGKSEFSGKHDEPKNTVQSDSGRHIHEVQGERSNEYHNDRR